ncbi:hypothetical protein [Photobacterium damselae]|uniref:hypothetical protein n=1 Tax=Photobacterium damselae TaxID=38293 RepID=UPI0040677342
MEQISEIKNFGNSLGFLLPKVIASELAMNAGDEIAGVPVECSGLLLYKKDNTPKDKTDVSYFGEQSFHQIQIDSKKIIPLKISSVGEASLMILMSKSKLEAVNWLPNTSLSLTVNEGAICIDTDCGFSTYTTPNTENMKLANLKIGYELLQKRTELLIKSKADKQVIDTNVKALHAIHDQYCQLLSA